MDNEKPVKVALNDVTIVFDNAREAIDVSTAALTKTVEAVDVKNDVCVHCLPQERGLINSIKKEKVEY